MLLSMSNHYQTRAPRRQNGTGWTLTIILACKGKIYCLDTSGLSNPLESMPEDIHATLWAHISILVIDGKFAVTQEIYEELCHLSGKIGDCIRENGDTMRLEVGQEWEWENYLEIVELMRVNYKDVISEYNGDRKGTVGLNDISIIALAKTLSLPVVSMEAIGVQASAKKMRIPQVCKAEGVPHMTFNQLLSEPRRVCRRHFCLNQAAIAA